jgi:peptidoglycan hydrolase-like protein with peptidoglycan-binding domain
MPLTSPRFAGNARLQSAARNQPPLMVGEPRSEAVAILQQALIDLGYPMPITTAHGTKPPDGIYGNETRRTVLQFQIDEGFPRKGQDGKAGKDTLARLDARFPASGPAPPPAPPAPPSVPVAVQDVVAAITDLAKKIPAPILKSAGVVLPTTLRFLNADEQAEAMKVYAGSMDFTKVLLSDGLGGQGRAFTVALPTSAGTFVVINIGPTYLDLVARSGFSAVPTTDTRPGVPGGEADKRTLIHELAHAWQSQHDTKDPFAFMDNSLRSQLNAALDAVRAKAAAGAAAAAAALLAGKSPADAAKAAAAAAAAEDSDAYAYVPGKPFGDFGAEQIAEQVEDFYVGSKTLAPIVSRISAASPNTDDPENIRGLATPRFERKSTPGVVFP